VARKALSLYQAKNCHYELPYPEGYQSYGKTKPMHFREFQREITWWGSEADGFADLEQTKNAWRVPVEEIRADNFNLGRKKPHAEEKADHDLEELLTKYERQQAEIQELRNQLKDILGEALSSHED
jgi:type I restriction enzyme M protein